MHLNRAMRFGRYNLQKNTLRAQEGALRRPGNEEQRGISYDKQIIKWISGINNRAFNRCMCKWETFLMGEHITLSSLCDFPL